MGERVFRIIEIMGRKVGDKGWRKKVKEKGKRVRRKGEEKVGKKVEKKGKRVREKGAEKVGERV